MNSSELTTELQSLGVLYVDSTTPTATVKIHKKQVQIVSLLDKHAETTTHLSKLGVQDIRLFYFNQNTKKPRNFFTGTVSISGTEIRMFFDDHAAEHLLSRAQYTGHGTGFFKALMEKGDKIPKHDFKIAPAVPSHPADIPTSDQSRLLGLPKELRDNISIRCFDNFQLPQFHGLLPPKPFDKIFGSSLPCGFKPLRATRKTSIALVNKQLQSEVSQLFMDMVAKDCKGGPRMVLTVTSDICPMAIVVALEDHKQKAVAAIAKLAAHDMRFDLDLVIFHPASSKMCLGCLIDNVLAAANDLGLEDLGSFNIHAIKSVNSGRSLEPADNPCGDFTRNPNVRILAMQKFDVQGGTSPEIYRIMQLHLGGKVTLESIIRPGVTAWRSLLEPDFRSQTLMRRLLLNQATSPVISATEAEVIGRELWAQPEAPDGPWSQMLAGVQATLGSLLSGKATPK
ncbi:hypothetical protein LTR56_005450 [Elasticomyces elasticus]|nr:hypothetical protein LTR22_015268 [Elasticomyces elasticus]KAK3651940.1 hypothetical protein LTR56_005450 [Elasticomyces elasticus]KAK4927835.1 hypothetical protein LTR49_005462 [Elasticomyces elasticus]KAK5750903.1 hypothetical protein LTS12_019047 [Elasticomyces elasticus]